MIPLASLNLRLARQVAQVEVGAYYYLTYPGKEALIIARRLPPDPPEDTTSTEKGQNLCPSHDNDRFP